MTHVLSRPAFPALVASAMIAFPFGAVRAPVPASAAMAPGGDVAATAAPRRKVPPPDEIRKATKRIGNDVLRNADEEPGNWLTHGRTYSEQRFSPLEQVNEETVGHLELAWSYDTGTKRGLEATPIVVDGVLYATGSWSIVYALDARTGAEIWKWDPKVDPKWGFRACCDVVNRGVALYEGRVYVGVLDGRLAALDAATGKVVWETVTVDQTKPFTITGAPRVVDGKVIIGNGGAEYGVRGYVSAYDADTGKLVWRTYTVPGDPSKPFESEAMKKAAETWTGEWWKMGGGGTVWDSMAYDPDLGLLYVGTGNGSPWVREIRSPKGGDNLYLSSILALDPRTGDVRWHYQTTPGDTWDFTATQHIILADLEIDGKKRAVAMQAPKNGFFYVLDRKTGELLSAEKYVEVTWAERVDLETGRPVEAENARFLEGLALLKPTAYGGHNWHPMSFNPKTGLVYLPTHDILGAYELDKDFEYKAGAWNTGIRLDHFKDFTRDIASGSLLAWDPVKQKAAWQIPYKTPWNGGTLTTAGNLVFQGTADGRFVAYRATDGKVVWQTPVSTGVIAAPVTWMADGIQYVTIVAGWGGAFALAAGDAAAAAGVQVDGKILTFALRPKLLERAAATAEPLPPEVASGLEIYHGWCVQCHGAAAVGGGVIPDLRKSSEAIRENFAQIVRNGIPGTGMPAFREWLTDEQIGKIGAYVRHRTAALAEAR